LCVQLQTVGALSTIVHEGLRLSLAGAQEKLPVILRGGELFLPAGTEPSTHILKLPSQSFRGLIDNEHFIMALAREAGLSVAPVALHTLPTGDTALLVERFDRRDGQRIHQEDFCQATGRSQHEKYETEGGPSLEEIVAVIRAACTAPARDIEALFRLVAFNTLVGNNDGHAKNIALLRDDIIRLAPAYDLVCTRAWPQLSADLAIRIGGRRRAGDIDAAAWDDEARACQVAPRLVRDIVRDTLARVETAAPALAATLMASGQTAKTPIRAALGAVTKHCHWARRASRGLN
jgi:serine/threonine-protein kinase HipA